METPRFNNSVENKPYILVAMRKIIALLILSSLSIFAGEIKDLQKYSDHWQQYFGMSDWKVTIRPVPEFILQDVMGVKEIVMGASLWDVEEKTGTIMILMREEYTPEIIKKWNVTSIKLDQQDSVLHEYLHNIIEHAKAEWAIQHITRLVLREKDLFPTVKKKK